MWNIHGVIPPVVGNGASTDRSPYSMPMLEFIQMFATSIERIKILNGLLNYRAKLYEIGINKGFQWVNGSFTENVEVLRDRPPNDIDVVSFCDFTSVANDPLTKNQCIFDNTQAKQQYNVDGYFVDLNQTLGQAVERATYWYSMWSHQRQTEIWKGFFSIALGDDVTALQHLQQVHNELSHA